MFAYLGVLVNEVIPLLLYVYTIYLSLTRYFDDEDESFEGAYQPAPGSPGPQRKESSDSDEDPLDAFMAGIEQEVGGHLHLY